MKIQGSIVIVGVACLIAAGSLMYGCGSNGPTDPGPDPDPGPGPSNTPFDSGLRNSGFSFLRAFPVAGDEPYFCIPHAGDGMLGTVTVSASSTTDSALVVVGPGGQLVFNPASVTVKVNGTVRWTWASNGHTVTSGVPTSAILRADRTSGTGAHGGH